MQPYRINIARIGSCDERRSSLLTSLFRRPITTLCIFASERIRGAVRDSAM
jgi:hypothetical protein